MTECGHNNTHLTITNLVHCDDCNTTLYPDPPDIGDYTRVNDNQVHCNYCKGIFRSPKELVIIAHATSEFPGRHIFYAKAQEEISGATFRDGSLKECLVHECRLEQDSSDPTKLHWWIERVYEFLTASSDEKSREAQMKLNYGLKTMRIKDEK